MAECLMTYFRNKQGRIALAYSSEQRTPDGYDRYEAHDIYEIMRIEKEMTQAAKDQAEQEETREHETFDPILKQIRRNIMTAIESSTTTPFKKDFLLNWCKLKDAQRRERYARLFHHRQVVAEALNYDRPRTAEELLGESV